MERAAITKRFNLLNSKEIKTFVLMKKDNSNMKALLLCISEFWGQGWCRLRTRPFLWLKSSKLKNGKQKSHSLVRTGHVTARSLIHCPVKHSIPAFCYHDPHALLVKMNYISPTVFFPQIVNYEIKDVLQRQCFSVKRINSKDWHG